MTDRIIDKDIQVYTASIEQMENLLNRCGPRKEEHYKALVTKHQKVLSALTDLRDYLDAGK